MDSAKSNDWMRLVGIFAVIALLLPTPTIAGDTESDRITLLALHVGQHADGAATDQWLNAARKFNDDDQIQILKSVRRPFTAEEAGWQELIASRLDKWQQMTPGLLQPFGEIRPPALVGVLIGNVGASDAFIADPTVIAFDLSQLLKAYKAASLPVNADRIDRIFAHEYTHVLHKIWRRERGLELESPLEVALWACLTEGVGNLRSLSARWRNSDGSLSEHSEMVLDRLTPVFVSRLKAIESATADEAEELMQGLSMAPFEEKWGALPVALWLAAETASDENELSIWIERGPWGVIELANRHLPQHLAVQLPTVRD